MKQLMKPLAISAIALVLAACSQEKFPANDTELKTDKDKQAYALGSSVGGFIARNLERQEEADFMLERDIVIAGFVDAVKGDPQLSDEEAEKILNTMRKEVMEQRQNVLGKKAAEEGKAYLAENAKKEGVQTTDSGLQYEVLKEGDGVSPSETDMVEVHYEGTLVNGEVFDSSYERGEPTSFPLNRVIPGWTEGLQLMKEGAKYRFVIPSELAYGDRELGDGQIPPNSTLIFTVELLNVQKDEPDTE
ncbi:FKBP-type peptidyl-prolyl cis-trans isomerase [Idiomarina loihiensis]|jgi:FKBP-type peptidyl-prolyl cis-trans isomerase FkpA|uniref:Peptidyl-prolyl cis-trans isomerase n=1 Tax=Idiomarina loihiensis (strain ATCC BAA-735 / DSM 15497 / L2-TR) TaxID=283942 RepID=Q5QVW7_IDILO|nr:MULTISPECIES: FKBP-type peptidyl-prolyl cis-trans isomerase [Idiomarina]AAV83141.1 FKBP-type peptidyl-prolyl cis-trans isomerase [Idiomarina loihiensis L2TR]AGM37186.1 FKBP-type peptidylprolyl isomerase [Idiomarina loihiensis GSL 199]MAA62083.1 peptidylprolyl isomerase [Idiomarina sp.]MBL4857512.1 FKBP-type peptidyl-prolyl cis-trans isomerase [Idiomarina sp.]MRJ45579.1 FKBP-type peptidyl-prolyl cis-trans isomerase [Idiomarina loihiensis]|tara:strand:- start:10871 stop:11611 length:741 start_codon:yes stop_codon:yes gene_type:complete